LNTEQRRLVGWLCLIGCLWSGEGVSALLPWSLPGSILGMIFMLVLCTLIQGHVQEGIRSVSLSIIPFLSLTIMPASAGILNHLKLLETEGLAILVVLVVSLALGMWATGWTFQWLNRGHDHSPIKG
jgi:holin-like protein